MGAYTRNIRAYTPIVNARYLESPMGEVVRFIPKSELERARLIREARAKYESIFPTEKGLAWRGDQRLTPESKVHQ